MPSLLAETPSQATQLFFDFESSDVESTPEPLVTPPQQPMQCFPKSAREAKPVRLGAVMIRLLKSYGITDAEIAEGLASYARKHQTAMAS